MTETTAGSLFAAFKAAGRHQGPRCTVANILDDLSPDDARDLLAAFEDPTIRATDVARVLRDRGYPITAHTLRRHVKRECNCA